MGGGSLKLVVGEREREREREGSSGSGRDI